MSSHGDAGGADRLAEDNVDELAGDEAVNARLAGDEAVDVRLAGDESTTLPQMRVCACAMRRRACSLAVCSLTAVMWWYLPARVQQSGGVLRWIEESSLRRESWPPFIGQC